MGVVLKFEIYSDLSEFPTEKRYDSSTRISELKKKLELITGADHKTMKITMSSSEGQSIELDKNEETLDHYLGDNHDKDAVIKLRVLDDGSSNLLAEDVPKYEISEEQYLQRKNNARSFIQETRKRLNSNE